MSLEQKIDNLVNVIEKLVTVIEARQATPSVVAQPEKVSAKPAEVPAPVVEASVAPAPVEAKSMFAPQVVGETLVGTPSMPPLPTFVAPVEPPKPGAPFSDPKGMIQYVTESYKALGPVKGAKIQDIITALGHHNINDIRPDQYASLYASMEALK